MAKRTFTQTITFSLKHVVSEEVVQELIEHIKLAVASYEKLGDKITFNQTKNLHRGRRALEVLDKAGKDAFLDFAYGLTLRDQLRDTFNGSEDGYSIKLNSQIVRSFKSMKVDNE